MNIFRGHCSLKPTHLRPLVCPQSRKRSPSTHMRKQVDKAINMNDQWLTVYRIETESGDLSVVVSHTGSTDAPRKDATCKILLSRT